MLLPSLDRLTARGFGQDDRGTTAILFALLLVPMLGIVFGGIDYSRAMSVQNQLQTAADAAATSAASRLYEGPVKAEAAFKAAFNANLPEDLKDQPYELNISGNGKMLAVELAASVPTTMVALLGLTKLDVAVSATAKRPEPSLLARSAKGGNVLDALPNNADGARARADIERAMHAAGIPAPKAPDQKEIAEANRQIREAMQSMGVSGNLAVNGEMPDPAELERMQRIITQELGRLRF